MTRKSTFFEGWSWFKFNNLGLALSMTMKFYTSVAKESQVKIRKFWKLSLTFLEFTGEKLVRGGGGGGLKAISKVLSYIINDSVTYIVKTPLTRSLRRKLVKFISSFISCKSCLLLFGADKSFSQKNWINIKHELTSMTSIYATKVHKTKRSGTHEHLA